MCVCGFTVLTTSAIGSESGCSRFTNRSAQVQTCHRNMRVVTMMRICHKRKGIQNERKDRPFQSNSFFFEEKRTEGGKREKDLQQRVGEKDREREEEGGEKHAKQRKNG